MVHVVLVLANPPHVHFRYAASTTLTLAYRHPATSTMTDRSRSPPSSRKWPRGHLHDGVVLDITAEHDNLAVVGNVSVTTPADPVAPAPADPVATAPADPVATEMVSFRLALEDVERRLRTLEEDTRFIYNIAVTAQARWRILRMR